MTTRVTPDDGSNLAQLEDLMDGVLFHGDTNNVRRAMLMYRKLGEAAADAGTLRAQLAEAERRLAFLADPLDSDALVRAVGELREWLDDLGGQGSRAELERLSERLLPLVGRLDRPSDIKPANPAAPHGVEPGPVERLARNIVDDARVLGVYQPDLLDAVERRLFTPSSAPHGGPADDGWRAHAAAWLRFQAEGPSDITDRRLIRELATELDGRDENEVPVYRALAAAYAAEHEETVADMSDGESEALSFALYYLAPCRLVATGAPQGEAAGPPVAKRKGQHAIIPSDYPGEPSIHIVRHEDGDFGLAVVDGERWPGKAATLCASGTRNHAAWEALAALWRSTEPASPHQGSAEPGKWHTADSPEGKILLALGHEIGQVERYHGVLLVRRRAAASGPAWAGMAIGEAHSPERQAWVEAVMAEPPRLPLAPEPHQGSGTAEPPALEPKVGDRVVVTDAGDWSAWEGETAELMKIDHEDSAPRFKVRVGKSIGWVFAVRPAEPTPTPPGGPSEPVSRRCTTSCGWSWLGTADEPCPHCDEPRPAPGGPSHG
jgi:hypothetical protein